MYVVIYFCIHYGLAVRAMIRMGGFTSEILNSNDMMREQSRAFHELEYTMLLIYVWK